MKVIWEEGDFKCGDRRNTGYPVKNDGNELMMLGWTQADIQIHYVVVSLRDGIVIDIGLLPQAVAWLNKYGYKPVFDLPSLESLVEGRRP